LNLERKLQFNGFSTHQHPEDAGGGERAGGRGERGGKEVRKFKKEGNETRERETEGG